MAQSKPNSIESLAAKAFGKIGKNIERMTSRPVRQSEPFTVLTQPASEGTPILGGNKKLSNDTGGVKFGREGLTLYEAKRDEAGNEMVGTEVALQLADYLLSR